jgi:hypothetical protein
MITNEKPLQHEDYIRNIVGDRIQNGTARCLLSKKVELLLLETVIDSVGAGETSKRGRWLSQLRHAISNFWGV